MANEKPFLLEYQEEGGNFYYNSMDEHHHPNTSGYRTIAICSFNECCDFSQAMNENMILENAHTPRMTAY